MTPFDKLKIAITNDHAGYEMKKIIVDFLIEKSVQKITDFGCQSADSCDYPDFAHPMAAALDGAEYDFGISICGSGNGINMVMNKHQGIRSALCWKEEIAYLARLHNNANAIALPGRFITEKEALKMVEIFLTTDFEGGRHERRIKKIPI